MLLLQLNGKLRWRRRRRKKRGRWKRIPLILDDPSIPFHSIHHAQWWECEMKVGGKVFRAFLVEHAWEQLETLNTQLKSGKRQLEKSERETMNKWTENKNDSLNPGTKKPLENFSVSSRLFRMNFFQWFQFEKFWFYMAQVCPMARSQAMRCSGKTKVTKWKILTFDLYAGFKPEKNDWFPMILF